MGSRIVRIIPAMQELKLAELKKKTRVAIYARVSTSSNEQLNSIEAQKTYYESYVKCHVDWELVGIYADEGITGTSERNRAEFKRMMDDALCGKIDLIISKSISRFARNTVDTLTNLRLLKTQGIAVYFEKEDINTLDAKGEFMITLLSSMAQEESRSISENVTWGVRKRMKEGIYYLPYKHFLGYRKGHDTNIEIVPEETYPICLIYYLYICGYSIVRIAQILEGRGIASPAQKNSWQASTVRSILRNEKYCGNALLQKTFIADFLTKEKKKNKGQLPQYFVADDHAPIISQSVWDYTQLLHKERNRNYSSIELSGILKCGVCGSNYLRIVRCGTYNPHVCFYRCKHMYHLKDPLSCSNTIIYEPEAYRIISETIISRIFSIPSVIKLLRQIVDEIIEDDNRRQKINRWLVRSKASSLNCTVEKRDIVILVRKASIMPNCTMKIEMLDGWLITKPIRKWTPRRYEGK